MSEFEMAYLMNDMLGVATNQFMSWISMVTAFLAIGYLISHRLHLWMIASIVVVYSYTYIGMVRPMFAMIESIQGLAHKMKAAMLAGNGLEWHAAKAWAPEPWLAQTQFYVQLAIFALIYVASIAFFVQIRHLNRKTESGTWKPRT